MAGKTKNAVRRTGSAESERLRARVRPAQIADADERIANIQRATRQVKTSAQANFLRNRRGRP